MQVDVPDIGLVDFPDDMTDEQITSAIEEHLRSPGAARTATIPQITLSPYEKADIASMEAGMGKAYQGPFQGGGLFGGTEEQRREAATIAGVPAAVAGYPVGLLGKGITALADIPTRIRNIQLEEQGREPLPLLGELPRPRIPRAEGTGFLAGAADLAAETAEGILPVLAPPEVGLTLPLAGGSKLVALGYGAPMALGVPEQLQQGIQTVLDPNATVAQKVQAAGRPLVSAGFAKLMLGHAGRLTGDEYASREQKAAEVYGDVRPQPREGPGPVPAEGGRPGVRPQAEVLAEEAQVLLTPEQRYLAAEREAIDVGEQMGMKVEFADNLESGQPFSKGRMMVPTPGGARINRAEYARFMNDTRNWTPEQRFNALRARLGEETIHRPLMEDPQGQSISEMYWNAMTGLEKTINYYRYTGYRSAASHKAAGIKPFEDWEMGAEAIRFQLQRIKGMEPTEIANEIGSGKLGMKAITLLEDAIRFMRQSFKTRAGQMQRDLLRYSESKLDLAKQIASMPKGRAPASYLKGAEADAKGKEMADALGMRLDGVREVPNRGAFFTFTLFDRAGKESSTITLPSDATLADVRAKYEAKIADYGDVPDAPRPPASGAPIKPEVAVRAPETPGKALNKMGDPMGTTYRGTPEDVAAYKAASARMAQRGPDMMDAWAEAERIKNKYGGMPPTESVQEPASYLKDREKVGPVDELRPAMRVAGRTFKADTLEAGHEQAMRKAFSAFPWKDNQQAYAEAEHGFTNAKGDWLTRDEVKSVHGAYTSERLSREVASYLKKGKGEPQPEFFMPEVAGKAPERGVPVQRELIPPAGVPREERITAEQAGAFVPKATELEAAAMANLSILDNVPLGEVGKADRPGFKPFMQRIKDSYGDIQPGQMVSLWEDAVWKKLVNASGETLAKLRKSLKLESRYGTRELSESVKPPDIQPEFGALVKGFPYKKPRGGAWAKQMNTPAAKYRATVISAIARKLIGEASESAPKVTRESIDAGDIAFWKETTEGPFHTITEGERRQPAWLEQVLTEGARVGPKVNATISNRVAVLLDKTTGNVEIVTVYKDPKSKLVMAVNPMTAHLKRAGVPIDTLMRRYQPIYSVLLDSPLKGFHQHFTTLADFNEAIGHEANRIAQGRTRQEMTAGGAFQGGVEPEEPPTRLRLLGEEAKQFVAGRIAIPGIFQVGKGQVEISRRIPLTRAEAKAVIDHVTDEVDRIESPEDMADALRAIVSRAGRTQEAPYRPTGRRTFEELMAVKSEPILLGRDRLVISAFQKAADRILKENTPPARKGQPPPEPTITPDQAWEQALNEYYQILQNHGETADQFAQTALSRFGERPPSTVGIPQLGPVPGSVRPATGARELTLGVRRPGVAGQVPPTVTRPEQVPGYVPPTKELPPVMTEADPGAVRSPEVLDREGLQWVESLAEKGFREETAKLGGRPVVSEILKPTGKVKFYPRPAPASYLKSKSRLTEEVGKVGASLGALVTRRGVKADIYRTLDGAESAANEYALKAGQSIRVISKNPMVRAAARAVIASGETTEQGWSPNPKNLDNFIVQIHNAQYRANNLLASKDWRDRFVGRKWLNAANRLQAEVEYAQQHWMDPELQDTALATRRELREEIEFEKANGSTINEIENYLPGMYEGEIFNDNAITFGALRTLGKNFRLPKTFKNYYDAIEAGPYIPSSWDVSNIAQSRIVRGRYSVEKRLWAQSLKGMRDPNTGEKVGADPIPVMVSRDVMDPVSGEVVSVPVRERWKSPSKTRELVYTTKGAQPVAVLKGYEGAVETASMESPVSKTPIGRAALLTSGLLKHGVVLILDTFHPGRLFQYGAALGGRNWRTSAIGYRGGYSALNYRAEDIPLAVQQGLITQAAADWALGTIDVQTRRGPLTMTRQQLASEFIRQGLNASKITDALYKDAVSRVPGIGGTWHKLISPLNKWVFDRMTPGLMIEGAVRNFERLNAKRPDVPVNRLMKDVITDINATFGNMRRQGIFKNPMFRDIAQIFLLAPMWREGLYQKELRFYSRITGLSYLAGRRGVPYMGTLGRGMARGLLAYFVLAQVMNLISRQKLTFQNEEEGHKLDAWIPTPGGGGFWLPTMGVFAEVLHDFIRLGETKPKVWDAIVQVGENMLGPVGKLEHVLTRGETPMGQKLTTTGAVLGAAGRELAPAPISLGTPVRYLASKVAPGTIAPPPPGALPQRALGAAGIKVTRAETPVQMIMQKAVRFMQENNLQRSTGYEWVTTDEPSYSKLRSAIRYKDWRAARNMLDALRKRLGDGADRRIVDDMQKYSRRPITGSDKTEQLFKNSLSDADLDLYSRATFQKGQEYNDFLEWFYSQPPQE